MECNKEEALKAKQVAETRMQSNDFSEALKFAQKARHLYPTLEGIAQMLAVCEVHCAAEKKLGSEPDWYAILQIETEADEITIKKQYRKLALLLHPDKNKFTGSEAAFKVIGEANRVLTDKAKRSLYDVKRKISVTVASQKHTTQSTSFSANIKPENAFWTMCPFCEVNYQCLSRFLHKPVICKSCTKPFIAFRVESSVHQKDVPNGGSSMDDHIGNHKLNCVTGGDGGGARVQENTKVHIHATPENKGREKPKIDPTKVKPQETLNPKPQEKGNMKSGSRKRGRKCPIDADAPSEGMNGKSTSENSGNSTARRSARPKKPFLYDENLNEGDGIASKKSKADTCSHVSVDDIKQETDDDSVSAKKNAKSNPVEPKEVEYPDPEFSDFDKDKAEGCFAAGQVWACYDSIDSMPRFYNKVVKVLSPGFRLKYTCIIANPDDEAEKLWLEEDLPVSCGKYRRGKTEETTDILMFSHQMQLISGKQRGSFFIYPRKGETWALFKNWDLKWSSEPEKHTSFEFDYVEVLSDFDRSGISVAELVKVKGFVSLFKRSDKNHSFQISKCELYRFSHRIPSFKMTGEEKKGVPVGSFEFDTAALPVNEIPPLKIGNASKKIEEKNIKLDTSTIRRSPRGACKEEKDCK